MGSSALLYQTAASVQSVLLYTLIPIVAVIVGGVVAAFWVPRPVVQSAIQHFAAGVVFAAVAVELLPDVAGSEALFPVVLGFATGVAAMLGVRWLTSKIAPDGESVEPTEADASNRRPLPVGLLAAVGVDILIDGLLVGVGFAAGEKNGVLLTLALTLEILFLGLSTSAALNKAGVSRGLLAGTTAGLAVLLAVGATLGAVVLSGFTGALLVGVLAFGLAALLYLVTEELLVEAHEVPETPLVTATFFAGFLVLLVITMSVA